MTREEVLSLKDGDVVQYQPPGGPAFQVIIRRPRRAFSAETGAAWIECKLEHPAGGFGDARGGITDSLGWLRWPTTTLVKPPPLPVFKGFKRIREA